MIILALLAIVSVTPGAADAMSRKLEQHARAEIEEEDADSQWFNTGTYDLNGDGVPEGFLMIKGPHAFCGSGGCGLEILKTDKDRLKEIGSALTYEDVRILPSITRGYHDIAVSINNGAGNMSIDKLCWNGASYKTSIKCGTIGKTARAKGKYAFDQRIVRDCNKIVQGTSEPPEDARFNRLTIDRIKAGMTEDEVEAILGRPTSIGVDTANKLRRINWTCISPKESDPGECRELSLEFYDGQPLDSAPLGWSVEPERPTESIWCEDAVKRHRRSVLSARPATGQH